MSGDFVGQAREVVVGLLEDTMLTPPEELARVVAEAAERLGARVLPHLVDYDQRVLVPFPPPGEPAGARQAIEGTLAGRCYRLVEPVTLPGEGRLWVPLVDGVDRLGVLEVTHDAGTDVSDPDVVRAWGWVANLVGHLITVKDGYGDGFDRLRRLRPRSVASELLWQVLPPLTFGTDRFVITGMLEPSYDVGGDAFDYGLDGDVLGLAVFDAMGHSLPAGLVAAVALASYRNSRREGRSLGEAADLLDRQIGEQPGGERFATAVLAELDLADGRLRYVSAGHPPPLVLRDGKVVRSLEGGRRLPLGMQLGGGDVAEEQLEPGDWLVLHTDGMVEARAPDGSMFGLDRLVDLLEREAASGHPAPETLRGLMHAVLDHQGGELQDDATLLVVQWRESAGRLLPGGPPE